jgi:hypothetical protein
MSTSSALAHGSAASIEEDICTSRLGGKMVHMSIYQPERPKAEFCREVAEVGKSYVVLDLVDPSLRNENVGIEVVRDKGGPAEQVIASVRPSPHPDGVLSTSATLEQGMYSVVVSVEGQDAHSVYPIRVKMVDYSRYILPTLLSLLILFGLYQLHRFKVLHKLAARFTNK